MKLTYTNINGYLVPNLAAPAAEEFGHYGWLRQQYLEEHQPVLFNLLQLEGRLNAHLAEVDSAARQTVQNAISRMAKAQGVDEALKRENPLEWASRMNTIKAAAEEAILPDFLYPEEQG